MAMKSHLRDKKDQKHDQYRQRNLLEGPRALQGPLHHNTTLQLQPPADKPGDFVRPERQLKEMKDAVAEMPWALPSMLVRSMGPVEVRVKGRNGVIANRHTNSRGYPSYEVAIYGSGSSVAAGIEEWLEVEKHEMELVPPGKKDRCLVVHGKCAGRTGILIGIDGGDGILKMDSSSDIEIIGLNFLARLHPAELPKAALSVDRLPMKASPDKVPTVGSSSHNDHAALDYDSIDELDEELFKGPLDRAELIAKGYFELKTILADRFERKIRREEERREKLLLGNKEVQEAKRKLQLAEQKQHLAEAELSTALHREAALRQELSAAQAELDSWRSGSKRLIPEVIDVDDGIVSTEVVSFNETLPVGTKRPLESVSNSGATSSITRLVRVKEERAEMEKQVEESNLQCGMMIGQAREHSSALGSVFSRSKTRYPPGDDRRVPWRALGEVNVADLMRLGLREEHAVEATTWQEGFWLVQPTEDQLQLTETNKLPPFIAGWAFVKTVVAQGGHEVQQYAVREQDEILRVERRMPAEYRGPPRIDEVIKSAAFVRKLRATYSTAKAKAMLDYLKKKFEEYERHSGGVGFSGYGVIHKLWNRDEDREMSLQEMLRLLLTLSEQ